MFTDIHSHVIWGLDDGAREPEQTEQMLRDAAADGISRILCTPHITPGVEPFPMDVFEAHFRQAEEYIRRQSLPLTLYTGAEILYTDLTPRLLREGKVPTLAGSRYVLVEFSPTDTRDHISGALQRVSGAGFVPVIAHLERYPALSKADQVKQLKDDTRALVQINARTLLRRQSFFRGRFLDKLFRENLVDFVATDVHAIPGRETCLTQAMQVLKEKYGEAAEKRIRTMPDLFFSHNG